jgi:coenzyme PQQ synthesis protein D (PqqD)
MPLEWSTVVVRSDGILAAEIDGEAVMLSIENGKYYGLDPVGTNIWNLASEPRSIEQICAALLDRYDVDAETCRKEVTELLEVLVADGSVVVVGDS